MMMSGKVTHAVIALAAATVLILFSTAAISNLTSSSNINSAIATSTTSTRILEDNYYSHTATATNFFTNNSSSFDYAPLWPLQAKDIIGFSLAAFGLIIAAGGGIGGGGMLVPIYILVLGFMPKHAIPLSNVTVFGGAVANTLRNVSKRHPNADRPLIDWDLILVMESSTLAGALIGANLNKILSETVIAVMLVLLLSFTAYSTLKRP
jgi:hypothetical protein